VANAVVVLARYIAVAPLAFDATASLRLGPLLFGLLLFPLGPQVCLSLIAQDSAAVAAHLLERACGLLLHKLLIETTLRQILLAVGADHRLPCPKRKRHDAQAG